MEDLETLQPRRTWNNSTKDRDFKNANTVPIVSIPLLCGVSSTILKFRISIAISEIFFHWYCWLFICHFKQVKTCKNKNNRDQKLCFYNWLYFSFQIALEITGIVFVCIWPEEENKCDTYFIFLYLHCLYWLIVIMCDGLYLRGIHESLRTLGYFEFYNSTDMLVKSPTFITSLWNTAFLLIAVILHHTHKWDYESYCRRSEWLTPINYILILTTVELTILIPVYVNYISKYRTKIQKREKNLSNNKMWYKFDEIVQSMNIYGPLEWTRVGKLIRIVHFAERVRSFIKTKPDPDVVREEWVAPCIQESYDEVGLNESESNLFELLERQANLIRYLKDHNIALSQQIIHLASQRPPDQR